MEGEDDEVPAHDPKKRKADDSNDTAAKKKAKADKPQVERQNTAVYITNLPSDVTIDELKAVFGKYGMIAEEIDSDQSRIKLYADDDGNFKGDALVGKLKSSFCSCDSYALTRAWF